MSGFVLDGWGLVGTLLAISALGVVIGAALGYYAASTDLEAERKKMRDAGFKEGVERVWGLIGSEARRAAARKRRGALGQDAPTVAARLLELRDDG